MAVGIVGYGASIPRYRIKLEEIAKVWGADAESYKKGLLLYEKSVPAPDQDTITLSVEASRNALRRSGGVNPKDIGALYIGSESHPYAVKPSGTIVSEAIGATPDIHCADFEFACKAGSEAMYVAHSHVKAGEMKYAMGIGADTSQGAPNDALEFSASAGGAAFLFGKEDLLAEVLHTYSYTSDTPDFWRREGEFYPRHGGRFTGEPAYFHHVMSATLGILDRSGHKPQDFKYAVNLDLQLLNTTEPVNVNNCTYHPMAQSSSAFVRFTGSNPVKVVVYILVPFILESLVEKIRISDHLDLVLFHKIKDILQCPDNKLVGDSSKTGS